MTVLLLALGGEEVVFVLIVCVVFMSVSLSLVSVCGDNVEMLMSEVLLTLLEGVEGRSVSRGPEAGRCESRPVVSSRFEGAP
mmetsp:Transcript_5394/g.22303  ORF Transcript_5394/g.22303 Transcript_5394/m.22303 type:complete len:82 (-) Transcript_5394:102-347(-)